VVPGSVFGEAKGKSASTVMLAAAAGVGVGCFLPWITVTAPFVGTISRSGVDDGGDGIVFLGVAAALAAVAFRSRSTPPNRRAKFGALALIVLLGVLTMYEFGSISSRFADAKTASDLISTSYGAGLILVALSVIVAGAGWLQMHGGGRGRGTRRGSPA
jgi:hypothetical protein